MPSARQHQRTPVSDERFKRGFAAGIATAVLGLGIPAAAVLYATKPSHIPVPAPAAKTVLKEPELVTYLWKSGLPERIRTELAMHKIVTAELNTASSLESAATRLQNRLDNATIHRLNFLVHEELNKNPLLQKQLTAFWRLEQKKKAWKGVSLSLAGVLALATGFVMARRYWVPKPRALLPLSSLPKRQRGSKRPIGMRIPTKPLQRTRFRRIQYRPGR